MHKRFNTFLLLIIIINFVTFSQENLISKYEINIDGTTQRISISKFEYNKHEGYIISNAFKYKGKNYTNFSQKDLYAIRDKLTMIIDSIKLPTKKVTKLIRKLKSNGIEKLKENDANYIVNEGDGIILFSYCGGLNGTFFNVKNKKNDKKIYFNKLNYKVSKKDYNLNKQRIKAQKLYKILITKIEFDKYWKEFNHKYEISEFNPFIKHQGYNFPKEEFNNKLIIKNVR